MKKIWTRWRNRHKHFWVLVTATAYDSITGPRTIPGYRCYCGRIETGPTVRGEWTVTQLKPSRKSG